MKQTLVKEKALVTGFDMLIHGVRLCPFMSLGTRYLYTKGHINKPALVHVTLIVHKICNQELFRQ